MASRLRWLLGDTFELRHPRDIELVDDLVTTTYMRGGGFTVAGDYIRHAARQIVGGEPPEVWATAERLERAGLDKGTILAELGAAWAIATAEACDPSRVHHAHLARLAALPISTAA